MKIKIICFFQNFDFEDATEVFSYVPSFTFLADYDTEEIIVRELNNLLKYLELFFSISYVGIVHRTTPLTTTVT